jgi:outer membrane murein-binding lipoprotein Lpp
MENENKIDGLVAETEAWQARCDELSIVNEQLREQRESARSIAQRLEEALTQSEEKVKELSATMDRLRLHIQQGVEL